MISAQGQFLNQPVNILHLSRRIILWVTILFLGAVLAACGTTGNRGASGKSATITGAGGIYKIGKPYQIAGVWYYPKEDDHYDHTGIASWYGPQFHGKSTANGESFNQEALTAAHPTLPMPTLVRVTNLENGRSLVVRVNDRGPFVAGREIDLSRKAAELLGYLRQGTARVRVQYLSRAPLPDGSGNMYASAQETFTAPKPEMDESEKRVASVPKSQSVMTTALAAPIGSKTAAVTAEPATTMSPITDAPARITPQELDGTVQQVPVAPSTNIFIQAGSFQNFSNAELVHQKLLAEGMKNVNVSSTVINGTKFYRVRLGPMPDVSSADASLKLLSDAGNAGARIIIE